MWFEGQDMSLEGNGELLPVIGYEVSIAGKKIFVRTRDEVWRVVEDFAPYDAVVIGVEP